MTNSRGIILIALGHPYYGKMALNMAASIKMNDPGIEILLLYDHSGIGQIEEQDKKFFNVMQLMPPEFYMLGNGFKYVRTKLFLYELSPFEETIYFDSDMVWLPRKTATQLFEQLKSIDFTMPSEGFMDNATKENTQSARYTTWAEMEDIEQIYGKETGYTDGRFYQLRSEFIYFKKTPANQSFFELAKTIYDKPKVANRAIGNGVADELAFDIAGMLLHHYPQTQEFDPVYWEYIHRYKRLSRPQIFDQFYAYSLGGNHLQPEQKSLYNDLVNFMAKKMEIKYPLQAYDKRSFLSERHKL